MENEKPSIVKRIVSEIKSIKHIEYIVAAIAAAVVLLLIFGGDGKENGVNTASADTGGGKTDTELAEILSSIKGAGRVKVFIMYGTSSEIVPAYDVQTQKNKVTEKMPDGTERLNESETVSSKVVVVKNEALILKNRTPEIAGVIVVAEGAVKIEVKMKLIHAVTTALGIDAADVEVFEMK